MARADFGGTSSDYVFGTTATRYIYTTSATLTFWDSQTGGTRWNDLQLNSVGVTSITVGNDGQIPLFQGPDGITQMWADAGGGIRVLIVSLSNIAAALATAGTTTDALIATKIGDSASATRAAGNKFYQPVITPEAYGAVGDGTTNDSAAFAAALTAAGVGGRVFCGPKRYKLNSGITLPTWAKLEGTASNLGSGGTATTELLFTSLTGATTGITLGSEAQLENIVVRGPGYSVGTVTGISGATIRLRRVSIVGFATGVLSTGGYYNGFQEVEWLRNNTGLTLVGDYNVDLYGCRFDCTTGATYGTAINAGTARGLNLYGGAIENYSTGILLDSASQLNLYGVYWESNYSGALGVSSISKAVISIGAFGNMVYLDNHNTWMRVNGSTDVSLIGRGNYFHCATGSATTPNAYYITPGQDVDLSGDLWTEVLKVGSVYAGASSGTEVGARLRIAWPVGSHPSLGLTANPVLTDGRIRITPQADQTLASAGAVTFNAASEKHRVTLNANATSSTITNAVNGQRISITFEQDATGSRTYAWPTACRFTGGSAPSGTAASTRNTVEFTYDSNSGKYYEVARATAVPV